MAIAFAELQDVLDIWGETLTPAQETMVTSRLAEASDKIRNDVGYVNGFDVDTRVTDSTLFASVVRNTCRNMVHRLLLNPRARSDIAIDDSKVTLNASIASGQMYITDDEMHSLTLGLAAGGTGAFTIRATAVPFASRGQVWPRQAYREIWPTWY